MANYLEWAKTLQEREAKGEHISIMARKMWRQALKVDEDYQRQALKKKDGEKKDRQD